MITAENLTLHRHGRLLLDRISLRLVPGRFTVIIGPNGAGKSTLLKLLCGDLRADSGKIAYDGQDITRLKPQYLARRRGVLPQSTSLSFPFTALEVVRMGAMASGTARPMQAARQALARVGLSTFEARPYQALSGGEQQRVQFARVLAQLPTAVDETGPRALFLDEPTSSLDLTHQISVLEIARTFAADGGMVLAVLHDLNLAAEFADSLIVLDGGQLIAEGPPQTVIRDDIIASVYGLSGTVSRAPTNLPFVLPQSRLKIPA
ncbi:heme ABC transporter ATP-binding protein [Agrobacterium vitis]|uniref:heme ABC transporter ATP-binding protein n=1 Tax=Agrobacterium vitis TaxID=373 RepID=UPI0012E8A081|nr:heme ABC transporter ATP-binding protein [Agrobacterium vitis]MUZ63455.1 heme ABC transporter ATP-binding protein [Agrobacterium vitis]MVA17399.1 heme ABC transporter ATP-binding protein [Agrobacterium vitis]